MARRKPVTGEDLDEFIKFLGIEVLPFQREWLLKILNYEDDIYFIPRRQDGYSNSKIMMYYMAIMFEDYRKKKESET